MYAAAPRLKHHRATTALAIAWLLAATGGFAPQPVAAQNGACPTIENDAERLACYDRALRPAPPATPTQSVPAVRRAQPDPAPATTAVAPQPEPRAPRQVRESTAPAAPAAPVAGTPEDLGIVPIVVVDVRALPNRGATFTTDSGEIWIQTDSRDARLPDAPFDAQIKPGAMSSYFLVPKNGGRAVRVRRGP